MAHLVFTPQVWLVSGIAFPLKAQALNSHAARYTLLLHALVHLFFYELSVSVPFSEGEEINGRRSRTAALAPSALPLFVCRCHVDCVTG